MGSGNSLSPIFAPVNSLDREAADSRKLCKDQLAGDSPHKLMKSLILPTILKLGEACYDHPQPMRTLL